MEQRTRVSGLCPHTPSQDAAGVILRVNPQHCDLLLRLRGLRTETSHARYDSATDPQDYPRRTCVFRSRTAEQVKRRPADAP